MSTALAEQSPTSTLDPYADEALLNPWPLYGELREMGPVVWLERYRMFALTRYDAVTKVLRDWQAFPSSFGVIQRVVSRTVTLKTDPTPTRVPARKRWCFRKGNAAGAPFRR